MAESLRTFLFNTNINENREMICNLCNRYLSVSPILYNNKLGNICGRCQESSEVLEAKKLKNKNAIMERQKVFESIARYLTFPCSFRMNGCDAELAWEMVDLHERDCAFKTTVCFLSKKEFLEGEEDACGWTGEPMELVSHFLKSHKIYQSSTPRIVLGLEASSIFGPLFGTDTITYEPKFQSKIFYIDVFESVAFVALYYEKRSNTYFCRVFTDLPYQRCKLLEYQLELHDDVKKNSVVFPRAEFQSLRNNFQKLDIDVDALEIDLNYMSKLLKMPHFITAEFRTMKKYSVINKRTPSLTPTILHNRLFDAKFIENFKCNFCGMHLSPPIYLCVNGHNICKNCKSEGDYEDECNACFDGWSVGERNFAMEKLTTLINFPCKNRSFGCAYVATMHQISEHEERCTISHKSRKCFFEKCSWQGTNFRLHVKDKHILLDTDKFYQVKDQECCFTFDDGIFALKMEVCMNNSIKFIFACCGSADLIYRYELEIMDGSGIAAKVTSRLIINQLCQPEFTAFFDIKSAQIDIPFILLPQLFSSCRELRFKINIFHIHDD